MLRPASPSSAPGLPGGSIERAIEYLGAVVDQETNALRTRVHVDLAEFNNRKNQGLLELNRALRALDPGGATQPIAARLVDLRAKLDVNRALLKTHMEAVREVASIVAEAIRDSDSDGTYSASIHPGGGSRS
jgi:hypothetical protein